MEYYCYKIFFFLIKLYHRYYDDRHAYHGVDRFHHLQHLLSVNGATVINIIPDQISNYYYFLSLIEKMAQISSSQSISEILKSKISV